ncbi:MAG: pilus assembly protein TadG-related protein [Terriglobales bacterium]
MRRCHKNSVRKNEQGLIITLVAIFMLGVVGAMAALSIDVVTFYTARSEAQLAADAGALAGARVLANSGMTSYDNLASGAATSCQTIAKLVAQSNQVGGQAPTVLSATCNVTSQNNPTVTVKVQATLPTFFARIWGTTQVTVSAAATAEAYNPQGLGAGAAPVAAACVKPLLFPNTDPSNGNNPIFDPSSGEIQSGSKLLGSQQTLSSTSPWAYTAGDTYSTVNPSFPPPAASSVTCGTSAATFNTFQLSVAGCVQTPIACNATSVNTISYSADYGPNFDPDTQAAVNCLTHSTNSHGDTIVATSYPPPAPFEFVAGADNPIVKAGALSSETDILVSDSLVTVPVYNSLAGNSATLVGFAQLFLNPDGNPSPEGTPPGIQATVVNLVGCGTGATGTPVYGNGPSAVPVRLITPAPPTS